jgi:hypothetical protein
MWIRIRIRNTEKKPRICHCTMFTSIEHKSKKPRICHSTSIEHQIKTPLISVPGGGVAELYTLLLQPVLHCGLMQQEVRTLCQPCNKDLPKLISFFYQSRVFDTVWGGVVDLDPEAKNPYSLELLDPDTFALLFLKKDQ